MMETLGRAEEAAAAAGGVAELVTRIMLVVSRTVLGQAPDVHEQLAALEPQLPALPLVHLGEPVGLLGQIAMTVEEFAIASGSPTSCSASSGGRAPWARCPTR